MRRWSQCAVIWTVLFLVSVLAARDDSEWTGVLVNEDNTKSILGNFYDATAGPSWTRRLNWLSSKPVCQWYGVKCQSNASGSIVM